MSHAVEPARSRRSILGALSVAAVAAAVGSSAHVALGGESNWLEGALLMLVFAIIAISFFEFQLPV